jgi:FKBP-type peptidyl-prolyl cis-trans isomerase
MSYKTAKILTAGACALLAATACETKKAPSPAPGAARTSTAPKTPEKPAAPAEPAAPAKPGPVTLAGGLVVEDLVIGTGAECKPGATVNMKYKGTLKSNGTEFQSGTIEYSLADLIQGWQMGVPGMKVGGKRKLTVPSALAYGAAGRPGIPPNADLVFEIELLGVK